MPNGVSETIKFGVKVENNSFIALQAKGGHSRLVPSKNVCPKLGGRGNLARNFIAVFEEQGC